MSNSTFYNVALSIVEEASKRNIHLRLLGATAIYYQCPKSVLLSGLMKRELTDLDFITTSKHASKISDFFSDLGFLPNERVNALYGRHRLIFNDAKSSLHVDIFFDKLAFNHVIDLSKRLTIDPFTISLSDLFLEKMQIVKLSEKDAKDTVVLVHEHDFRNPAERGDIDSQYILKILSDDWGFYYTVTTNVNKVMAYAEESAILSDDDKNIVNSRLKTFLGLLESSKKSLKWNMRARIGTRSQWYDEAESVENRELV